MLFDQTALVQTFLRSSAARVYIRLATPQRAPQLCVQSQIVVFCRGCATSRQGPAGIDVLAVLPPGVLEIR